MKILVADDHAVVREGLGQLLDSQPDMEVVGEAKDGREAHEKAKSIRPDVTLLDIAMPGMDGMEVLKKIREKEDALGVKENKKMPVIMVTAHREPFFDAFRKGCDDYINKPIRPEMLIERMERLLRER